MWWCGCVYTLFVDYFCAKWPTNGFFCSLLFTHDFISRFKHVKYNHFRRYLVSTWVHSTNGDNKLFYSLHTTWMGKQNKELLSSKLNTLWRWFLFHSSSRVRILLHKYLRVKTQNVNFYNRIIDLNKMCQLSNNNASMLPFLFYWLI